MTSTQPTAKKLEFGADELFFSTTDPQGRIQQANDVFVRLAQFSRAELVSSPHNIVRHPDMPGGTYRLMWDSIQAGKAFGGYIRNLSKDGGYYDVFATVTALPSGGYLSVRSLPMDAERFDSVFGIYADARAKEAEADDAGASSRKRAEVGAEAIQEAARALGYDDYRDFQIDVLVDEVTKREEALEGSLGMVITNTIDLIVRAGMGVHAEVSVLFFEHEALGELAQRVETAATKVAEGGPHADPELATDIDALYGQLKALGTLSRETQFQIALARLHAAMVTQYADERFDIVDPVLRADSYTAIKALVDALVAGIDTMVEHINALESSIEALSALLTKVGAGLGDARPQEAFEALRRSLRRFDARYDERPLIHMRAQLLDAVEQSAP